MRAVRPGRPAQVDNPTAAPAQVDTATAAPVRHGRRWIGDLVTRNALIEDDSDVRVGASGNTVTLRGHVRSWAERDAVAGAASMAGGVIQVRDDLDITG